ncbi:MAG: triose-phosphate isomerase family protein, partial [Nitrospiria bacterium]
EISPSMLRDVGCRYVIIGHSERRRLFGETDAQIHLKLDAAVKAGLNPILCVGETLQERREGKTWAVLERQLREAFGGNFIEETGDFSGHIIAYEPVWAIGTGQTANPGDAESVHQRIKTFISEGTKRGVPHVLYGGSVTENNIEALMKEAHVDGVLVGGSSLSAESFLKIIKLGAAVKN